MVTLRPIDESNRATVEALRVTAQQERFVSSVAGSLVEAAEEPDGRALYWRDRLRRRGSAPARAARGSIASMT
jgi:hypothetical protein